MELNLHFYIHQEQAIILDGRSYHQFSKVYRPLIFIDEKMEMFISGLITYTTTFGSMVQTRMEWSNPYQNSVHGSSLYLVHTWSHINEMLINHLI
jgi:hypothetical protein